jgi:hypothetical protein
MTPISEFAQSHMLDGIQDYQKELISAMVKNLAFPPRYLVQFGGQRSGRTYAQKVVFDIGSQVEPELQPIKSPISKI